MSNDLILEVEESIRQERLERLVKEYGGTLIAAAVLAVVMTAGIAAWRSWNSRINISQTTAVITALAQDDQVAALDKITDTLRPDQRAVAILTAAGLLARDGKAEEALAHYRKAASDKAIPENFRDLAKLMAVRLEWTMAGPGLNPQILLSTLQTISGKKDSPWRYHAHMLEGIIVAHAYNDYAKARDHLAMAAKATDVPPSLKKRAGELAHVYGLKGGQSGAKAEKPADTAAAAAAAPAKKAKEEPEG